MSTNYERWNLYTKNLPSPRSYIDFGYYFLVASCLQRRVWYYGESDVDNAYEEGRKLYINPYIILCGPPGCGKGAIISKVSYFLKYHKNEKLAAIQTNIGKEKPGLFPMGADSLTFEELLDDISLNTSVFATPDKKAYVHCSYVFVLQELDSLFSKKGDNIAKFLKNAYDCVPYDRKTKHQGNNLLRRLCLSLIAGTQHDFLKEASSGQNKIFGQGFSSRSLFIYETDYAEDPFHVSDLSPEQAVARDELLNYIKHLSLVYGEIKYSRDTYQYLEDWYTGTLHKQRAAASPRMQEYYSRKRVNLLKLAAAVHFSDSLELTIETASFQKALALLDSIEANMEAGFNSGGRNQLYNLTKQILDYFKSNSNKVSRRDLFLKFSQELTYDELENCIKQLEVSHNLRTMAENNQKIYVIK